MKPANISKQRIMGQANKLKKQKLAYLNAGPLTDDLYNWHFTIQGPQNTQFHQGIYHGQILLPFEYPFKPPDIVFMNKNGRFETGTKICLTITQYHPEEWNSAWTIQTMLEAVISLFAENMQGVGALTSSAEIRLFLAKNSHAFVCEKCGPIKELLTPRPPKKEEQNKQKSASNIQKEAKVQQNTMMRKMSQQASSQIQAPFEVKKKYSEDLKDIPSNRFGHSPNLKNNINSNFDRQSHLISKIRQQPILQILQDDGYERKGQLQIIYIRDKNNAAEALMGMKTVVKAIQLRVTQLDKVTESIRWVD